MGTQIKNGLYYRYIVLFIMLYPLHATAEEIKPINSYFPKPWDEKLKINVETRYRFEYQNNLDFDGSKDDDDGFHLLRTRINLDFEPVKYFRTFVQLQDSRIWASEFSDKTPYEDIIDFRQAYIDLKGFFDGVLTLRTGRQELAYGKERLLGGFNWSNVAQSFDAAKIMFNYKVLGLDLFASRKVVIDSERLNDWDEDDNFYGAYATYKGIENHAIDFYYLFRDTDKKISFGPNVGSEKLEESTVGLRLAGGKLKGFDYEIETALQFGGFGDQDILAFAFVTLIGYTFDAPWQPRIGLEWDHASGDEDKNDGKRNTFDNLYPTNHIHYGYMDRASLQNLNDFRVKINANPTEKLYLETEGHLIFLDETNDSLYNAGRKVIRTAKGPDVSNYVGLELDFLLKYNFNKNLNILAGYSHFFPGTFLEKTGKGDNGNYVYTQFTLTI